MSSQPTSESGMDRIWETRMQKWMKCNVPPMRQADVFGAGSGTLFGKIDISKAIRDGKAVILALKVSYTVAEGCKECGRITFQIGSSCARRALLWPFRSGCRYRFSVRLDAWGLEESTVGSAGLVQLPSRRANSQRLRETQVEIELSGRMRASWR
jgi:hypothetical protein